ncbi:MAG: hypothetical protein KDB07_13865 [Planctomycetes bacterium]|nr:hypothetical protein [Planctomycetota bacterium]
MSATTSAATLLRELQEKADLLRIDTSGRIGINQAAMVCDVHPETLRNWHKRGRLSATRATGRRNLMFKLRDLAKAKATAHL